MSEELMRLTNRVEDEFSVAMVIQVGKKLERLYGKGISNIARGALDRLNVLPDFVQVENSAQFADLRARLNKEPGVLISNHPNGLDALLILSLLERDDVLIFASAPDNKNLEAIFGKGRFVAQGEGPKDLQRALARIHKHIEDGGLFLIFPTGGLEEDDIEFKSGFQAVLRHMRPTDMVYACNVDLKDAKTMEERLPRGFAFIEAIFDDKTVKRRQEKEMPIQVRVDERYTTALEWQEALGDSRRKAGNLVLSEHYQDLFSGEASGG